jgi:GNAT superfamily N-acetyltransferase
MRVRREDGYEIDTAPERLDLKLLHAWLSTDAYWARGRSAEVVARSVEGSLCFGVYAPDGALTGFARVVTDGATFAWLCDVYVSSSTRGIGLGGWLVRVVRDHLQERGVYRILLATADAHEVYTRAGFTPLAVPGRWMEIDLRDTSDFPEPREVRHT